jgi:hypothetical protein
MKREEYIIQNYVFPDINISIQESRNQLRSIYPSPVVVDVLVETSKNGEYYCEKLNFMCRLVDLELNDIIERIKHKISKL